MKKRSSLSVIVYILILALAIGWLITLFGLGDKGLPYSQVVDLFRKEQVRSFYVADGHIYMELYEPLDGELEVTAEIADVDFFRQEMRELISQQSDAGILVSYNFAAETQVKPFDYVAPALLVGVVLLLIWFILMVQMNNRGGANTFGKARTVLGLPDDRKVTFQDVAGADEEKAELQEVVDFLRDPEKYTRIGARIPHGILLVGPPGNHFPRRDRCRGPQARSRPGRRSR